MELAERAVFVVALPEALASSAALDILGIPVSASVVLALAAAALLA